jgi:transposase
MKTIQHTSHPVHIGIDVAKDSLQLDLQGQPHEHLNTKAGHTRIIASLPPQAFVVMEATGSYHLALMGELQAKQIPVAVVNPARVKQFARARGTLAKTDPVDAEMISAFGRAFEPLPTPPQHPQRVLLRELVNLRDALVAEIIKWNNLADHHQATPARRIALAQAKGAQKALKSIELQISTILKESSELAPAARVIQECKGIGPVTGAVLLAEMPELGRISRRQAAALAGLAPYANDSGKSQGRRITRAGRPRVKRALYLAALSALRHHPTLKPFYQALRKSGKPAKVAIIAVARKLLVILNAKLKEFYESIAESIEVEPVKVGRKPQSTKLSTGSCLA